MPRRLRVHSRAAIGSIFVVLLAGLSPPGHLLVFAASRGGQTPAPTVPLRALYDTGKALGIPVVLSVGGTPQLITAADDDGDGVVDLVMATADLDRLRVFRGDGLGRFADPGSGRDWRDKVVANVDVDGDGRADEIVGRASGIAYSVRLAAGGGQVIVALVTDFNRDGVADLAVSDGPRLAIYHGDRDGELRAVAPLVVGGDARALAIGDFNGDDQADLAVAHGRRVSVFVDDGRGGFALRNDIAAGVSAAGLHAADVTGDGFLDLAVADAQGDAIAVIRSDGPDNFLAPWVAEPLAPGRLETAAPIAADAAVYEGVASLALNPPVIDGGTGGTAIGTVTLNAPAPAGGVVVTLGSSNVELAATAPNITIPAGATQGAFAVTTNASYRRFSGLALSVTISASHAATVTATLGLTAQARPADFNSGVAAGDQTQWSGLMCSNIPPLGLEGGILFECSLPPAVQGQWGSCTFRQECSLGCRRVPPSGSTFNDFCATTGPNPVAVSRNYVTSGDRVPASLILEAPAAAGGTTSGFVSAGTIDANALAFASPIQPADPFFPFPNVAFATGTTTAVFDVGTSYVPSIGFVAVNGEWHPPGGGGNFFIIDQGRSGHAWFAMTPPSPPPATPIPTLGNFRITGSNPVTGGQGTLGNVSLSGLAHGSGPTITVTSSHPAIASGAPASVVAPVSNLFGFDVNIATNSPAVETAVTITVSDGRYSFSDVLTVRPAPPPPVLSALTVNPTSVVGGSLAIGAVALSGPQSGPTVIDLDQPFPSTVASLPASITVPAGATSGAFTISTAPRTAADGTFSLNLGARVQGATSPGPTALLKITPPAGPLAITGLVVNPVDLTGGNASTGTVTMNTAAPAGGATVSLFSDRPAASVPANVIVPAGATSASFTITTTAVPATTSVRISAVFSGVTANADMTLFTLLSFVSFAPNPIVGGASSTGTVHLGAPASAGGAVVTLAESSTLATLPATSVTVPAGQTDATFTINTNTAASTAVVSVSASYGGVTVSEGLTVLSSTGRTISSVTVNPGSLVGPGSVTGTVTLTGPVSSCCATVEFASSNTALVKVPLSLNLSVGQTSGTFTINTGSVIAPRDVTISAILNGSTRSATLTVVPPGATTLSAVSLNPASVVGEGTATGTVTLTAAAPSGGAVVTLSDDSSATTVPAGVTVPAGAASASFTVTTSAVTASTLATISATFGGVTRTAGLTVNPLTLAAPTLLSPANFATPAQPVTFDWSDVANAATYEIQIDSTSTIAAPFVASQSVSVSQAAIGGLPAQALWWRVRGRSAAGVAGPFSSTRRFTPQAASASASLSAVSLNPGSVTGGTASTGTVTLTGAAPTGGALVTLSSSHGAAVVPSGVTVPAGATSATFAVTTSAVSASTAVTITGSLGVSRSATLTVNPAGQANTLTVTASGRSGERITSSPAGINVAVGSTGSASFATGTAITLSVASGRDAVWSGACSSGGNKRRTCTFTITSHASVTANVQ